MKKIVTLTFVFMFASMGCSEDTFVGPYKNVTDKDSLPAAGPRWIENQWRMILQADGRWGYDQTDDDKDGNNAGAEFPRYSGLYGLYAGGLYIGAIKDGLPRVSQIEYQSEFTPGGITNTTPAPFSQLTYSSPDSARIYVIDDAQSGVDWRFWPVEQGALWDSVSDQPLLLGNQDSWSVCHDLRADSIHADDETGNGFGVELHRMTTMIKYGYMADIVFIRYRIINKSNVNYSGAYVSWWLDHNLGSIITNDVPGTDTLRNMVYTYNLTGESSSTGQQYAVGHQLLYFTGSGTNTKLCASNAYSNGTDPRTDNERYNLIRGLTKLNGLQYPDSIVGVTGGTLIYPGDPVAGTGTLCHQGRNGRLMASVGPFVMQSGGVYDILFAVIGGEGNDRLDAIVNMRQKADQLKQVFPMMLPYFQMK